MAPSRALEGARASKGPWSLFISFNLHSLPRNIKEEEEKDEEWTSCDTNWKCGKFVQNFGREILMGETTRREIVQWILKWVRVCTGCIWLRTGPTDKLFWTCSEVRITWGTGYSLVYWETVSFTRMCLIHTINSVVLQSACFHRYNILVTIFKGKL
jgi:hypothetical protein